MGPSRSFQQARPTMRLPSLRRPQLSGITSATILEPTLDECTDPIPTKTPTRPRRSQRCASDESADQPPTQHRTTHRPHTDEDPDSLATKERTHSRRKPRPTTDHAPIQTLRLRRPHGACELQERRKRSQTPGPGRYPGPRVTAVLRFPNNRVPYHRQRIIGSNGTAARRCSLAFLATCHGGIHHHS